MKVLIFGADWCPACKEVAESLQQAANDIEVVYIDIEQHPHVAKSYGVIGFPTMIRIDEFQKEVSRLVGYHPLSKIRSWLSNG